MINPSLIVRKIEPAGSAAKAGIKPGDRLESANGYPVRDVIDFRYYGDERPLQLVLDRAGKKIEVVIRSEGDTGLDFEPFPIMRCGNRCVFCFIDQNPEGLRKPLYIKDEDYRLSFLHGNYVTLTRIGEEEIRRILDQRLSPLYVSIHALDQHVRKRLLGIKNDDHLIDKLHRLIDGGIELHGQIVLCPGWNDGKVLEETVAGLQPLYPGLKTLAVVPVGLTAHRGGLTGLKGLDGIGARRLLKSFRSLQKRNTRLLGEPFLYFADEIYLMAGQSLPALSHYAALYQIENGVGLTRYFLDQFKTSSHYFPKRLEKPRKVTLVTGSLAEPGLERHVVRRLNRIGNLKAELVRADNTFYGGGVTVAGLLAGSDILGALKKSGVKGLVLLSPSCLNADGRFLDDMVPRDIEKTGDVQLWFLDEWESLMEYLR